MKFKSTLLLLLLFSGCATSHQMSVANPDAQERSPAAAKKARLGIASCMNMNSTVEIFSCLDDTYSIEEKRLNDSYKELTTLLKTSEPERFDKVRMAELAWIRMRDADCAYEASADEPGDASGAADAICKIKATIVRRADLELRLGDLKRHLAELNLK